MVFVYLTFLIILTMSIVTTITSSRWNEIVPQYISMYITNFHSYFVHIYKLQHYILSKTIPWKNLCDVIANKQYKHSKQYCKQSSTMKAMLQTVQYHVRYVANNDVPCKCSEKHEQIPKGSLLLLMLNPYVYGVVVTITLQQNKHSFFFNSAEIQQIPWIYQITKEVPNIFSFCYITSTS